MAFYAGYALPNAVNRQLGALESKPDAINRNVSIPDNVRFFESAYQLEPQVSQ